MGANLIVCGRDVARLEATVSSLQAALSEIGVQTVIIA